MKSTFLTLTAVAIWLFASLPLLAPDQQPGQPVPVHEEPRHHLVFEHPAARILDVRIPPGDTTLFHIHDAPVLYVGIGVSRTRAQVLGGEWVGPAERPNMKLGGVTSNVRYSNRPITHRVENVGEELFRLIAIINRAPAGRHDTITAGRRPATPIPQEHHPGLLEVDDPWFGAYRVTLEAGASSGPHRHTVPTVVVQVSPGASSVVEENAETARHDHMGAFSFHEAGSLHELTNPGSTSVELIEVHIR